MNLEKVINICKKAKRFVVFRQNPKTQWLGDDVAAYLVTNSPKFTPEYLTASASLKPQDVESTVFKNTDFPDAFETSDNTVVEIPVELSEITINFSDGEYTPVFTTKGVRFVKTVYFEPFSKEDIEIFERLTAEGQMYFVIKVGMFVNAIIIAQDNYLDTETVAQFETIAKKMQFARLKIEEKDKQCHHK